MNEVIKYRTVITFKNYFEEFLLKLTPKAKLKIIWTLQLIEEVEKVPKTYLKHVEGTTGLYEIRIQSGSDIFRIFCFFDQGNLVVLTTGYQKTSKKAPKREITQAQRIMEEYYENKR